MVYVYVEKFYMDLADVACFNRKYPKGSFHSIDTYRKK